MNYIGTDNKGGKNFECTNRNCKAILFTVKDNECCCY